MTEQSPAPDLRSQYLGLSLRCPVVASPSPLTGRLHDLHRLDAAGVGAVVLPSLFEEDVEAESLDLFERQMTGADTNPEAGAYFPDLPLDHLGLERHLALVQQAVAEMTVPVIASINGNTAGGWVGYAREMQDCGAVAIELNMYDVVADPSRTSAEVEGEYLRLVSMVCDTVSVPVAVKVSPYFTSFANMATHLVDAGAAGLVLFNRFYQPDLDLQTLDVTPVLELSHTSDLRLPLRWIALLRPHLPTTSLALTSGVGTGLDIAKALLAGADVAMVASEVLRHGPERVADLVGELRGWLVENEYESVDQLRGSVAHHTASNPGAFERAQYRRVLASWRR